MASCAGQALWPRPVVRAAAMCWRARPAEIRLSDVIMAVDEPLRVTRCEGDAVNGCVKGKRCSAHDLWSSLGRQMMYFLESISLEDVVEQRNLALPLRSSKPRTGMCGR